MTTRLKSEKSFLFRFICWTLGSISAVGLISVAAVLYYFGHDLPSRLDLKSAYRPAVVSTVYDVRGQPIGEFYHQRRIVCTANSAVSWSIPTLTQPALAARS